jgi:UDP-N-acetylmuramate: L-alanyl-gamma-D-glutamyl-meso-diaminopimelate ligase
LILVNGDDLNACDVTQVPFCPVRRFGSAHTNDYRIQDIHAEGRLSHFNISGDKFSVPMAGEFNVRNATAAILAARHCGLSDEVIQRGLASFRGVCRRMTVSGEVAGVTVIDDFAHHPTAIGQTLGALRQLYPGRRLVTFFEPRSNTTRRQCFQESLPVSLGVADLIYISEIARKDQLKPEERLNEDRVIHDIRLLGREAGFFPTPDDIIRQYMKVFQPGDIVAVLSNGGFGGIHQKLLQSLRNHSI